VPVNTIALQINRVFSIENRDMIMKSRLPQTAKEDRPKKSVMVRRAWDESGYEAVIKHFRDNRDKFGRNMMQALEAAIIEGLMELDDGTLDDYEMLANGIRSIVLENLVRSTEVLGVPGRVFDESIDRAWKEFDELDIF
jgi:hypothetical protein